MQKTTNMLTNHRLRIGVSLHYRDEQQSIWENGIFQNCFFLAQLLRRMPQVDFVALIIDREDSLVLPESMWMAEEGIPVLGLRDAMTTLNLVVELSALLPDSWAAQFKENGGRYYWMRVGNDLFLDVERAIHNFPPASLCSRKSYDAILTIPEYERSCLDYFSISARAPVRIVPHIWTPYFLERGISQLANGLIYGYQPGRKRWRIATLEPNVSMVKTSLVPMLGIEHAYRQKPQFLEAARICNSLSIKDQPGFAQFSNVLDIVRHGVASFDGRVPTPQLMSSVADAVISHQWENGQNYLYYELLYGGYPLIHNSEYLGACGYYYDGFDALGAGNAILDAFEQHDGRFYEQRASWTILRKSLDISCEENIRKYISAIS